MRVIVTGSRVFKDRAIIAAALNDIERRAEGGEWADITLVHGGAPGADTIAAEIARDLGWRIEAHPADWERYGKRAGYIRNREMADAGADLCLAFPIGASKGTRMMMDLAERAGIRLEVWEA